MLGDREPTVEDLKRMPYTLQVIKETMRLYPAAPLYVRDATQDDVIDGKRITAGSAVILSPFLTHRHPQFWDEPERFDPERWTPEREASQHPYAYHPSQPGNASAWATTSRYSSRMSCWRCWRGNLRPSWPTRDMSHSSTWLAR